MHQKINLKKIDNNIIEQAVKVINDGGVIIYPTDTIYGLGCDAGNTQAVKRIQQIKGRNKQHPFSIICPDLKNISQLAFVNNSNYKILKKYLPGPFTFILPATKLVPKLVQHPKTKTVGVRIPDHPICLMMAKIFNKPIVTTSVNKSSEEPSRNPDIIVNNWLDKVDYFLDVGLLGDEASTVIDLTGDRPVIVRQGKGEFLDV